MLGFFMKSQSVRLLAKTAASALAISTLAACTPLGSRGRDDKASGFDATGSMVSGLTFEVKFPQPQLLQGLLASSPEAQNIFADLDVSHTNRLSALTGVCTASIFNPELESSVGNENDDHIYALTAAHCFWDFFDSNSLRLQSRLDEEKSIEFTTAGDEYLSSDGTKNLVWQDPPVIVQDQRNRRLRVERIWIKRRESPMHGPHEEDIALLKIPRPEGYNIGIRYPYVASGSPNVEDPTEGAFLQGVQSIPPRSSGVFWAPPDFPNMQSWIDASSCQDIIDLGNLIRGVPNALQEFPWIVYDLFRCSEHTIGVGYGVLNRALMVNSQGQIDTLIVPQQPTALAPDVDAPRTIFLLLAGAKDDRLVYVSQPLAIVGDGQSVSLGAPSYVDLFGYLTDEIAPGVLQRDSAGFSIASGVLPTRRDYERKVAELIDSGAFFTGDSCGGDSGAGLFEVLRDQPYDQGLQLRSLVARGPNPCMYGFRLATELSQHKETIQSAVELLENPVIENVEETNPRRHRN